MQVFAQYPILFRINVLSTSPHRQDHVTEKMAEAPSTSPSTPTLPFSTVAAPTAASENPPRLNVSGQTRSFTLFPKLATELRNKIWKLALPDPQIIEITYDASSNPESSLSTVSRCPRLTRPKRFSTSTHPYLPVVTEFKYGFGSPMDTDHDGWFTTTINNNNPLGRDFIHATNRNAEHPNDGTQRRPRGTWKIKNGMPCIAILQVCQEARAETKPIIGTYMMLRLDPNNSQRFWFNPTIDSILMSMETSNSRQERILGPGFPLGESIKTTIDETLVGYREGELRAEDASNGVPPQEHVVPLPHSFQCSISFAPRNRKGFEDWRDVKFQHKVHAGVEIFRMCLADHVAALLGMSVLDFISESQITPLYIQLGKSTQPNPEDIESRFYLYTLGYGAFW
jgi:hypothetical protein